MENYAKNVVVVFCYLIRNGEVLLIRRNHPPAQHEYTVVGGKKEMGENLITACKREVLEETNLVLEHAELKGIITNSIDGRDYDFLTCYFLSESFSGELKSSHEGDVEWCKIKESFQKAGISDYYLRVSPYVLNGEEFFHGSLHVNAAGKIDHFHIEK